MNPPVLLDAPLRRSGGGCGGLRRNSNSFGATNASAAAAGRNLLGRPRGRPDSILIPSTSAPPTNTSSPRTHSDALLMRRIRRVSNLSFESGASVDLELRSSESCMSSLSSLSFMSRCTFVDEPIREAAKADRKNEEFDLHHLVVEDAPSASSTQALHRLASQYAPRPQGPRLDPRQQGPLQQIPSLANHEMQERCCDPSSTRKRVHRQSMEEQFADVFRSIVGDMRVETRSQQHLQQVPSTHMESRVCRKQMRRKCLSC